MTQNQPGSDIRHHVLSVTEGFRHWLDEPSESSAQARADDQAADPQAGWSAIWIIPCTGDAVCPVCATHRKDIDEDHIFRDLTADREPYWERH